MFQKEVRKLYRLDPDGIGVTGLTVDPAAGQYHSVAFPEMEDPLRVHYGEVEHDVHGIKLLGKHRDHAPRQIQFAPCFFCRGHADDADRTAEAADKARGNSRAG